MKKMIICVALICAAAMFTGCQSAETATSQQSDVNSAVSYITDESDNNTVSSEDEASDSENTESNTDIDSEDTSTEADSETDSDSEAEIGIDFDTDTLSEDITEENTEDDVIPEEIESSLSGYEEEISGVWTAAYILDQDNNEIDGSIIYGTAYSQYGGELDINSDGTFSARMGINTENETTKGTFTYNGGSEISLLYYDDTTVVCERCTLNGEDAIAMPVNLFDDVYTVYFMR